ncbi:thiol reductant ABC exporter subunit CydD [Melioribacter sp. OK-6-Me]|uniref:thiol reductant ABC exporter subunit CydD n=1 Tax=unclassified Melioribacter TaxID=2627329 RepID=UPI003EDA18DE
MHFNKTLYSFIKGIRINFLAIIILGLFVSISTIGQAFLLSRTINNVFLIHKTLYDVRIFLIIFLIVSLLKSIFLWLQNLFSSKVIAFIKKLFREKIISAIEEIGPLELKSERTGEITNTLIQGVDKLEEYFSKFLPQIFLSVFIPLLILILVFPLDILTGVIFLLTAPIIPLFMYLIGSIAEKMNKKQWQTLSRMSAYFFDVLQGLPTLKLFNKTNDILKRIEEISNIFRIKTLKVLRIAFLSALVLEMTATISVAVIAVAIGLRLLNGNFNFADALFILIIAPEFYMPLRQLGVSYHAGMEGVSAFERIYEIIKSQERQQKSYPLRNQFYYDSKLPIVFQSVSFNYSDRSVNAIDNISFAIEPTKVTALVGYSGAGKSTIINLLLKFISPTKGSIKIGNFDLSEIDPKEWRKNLTFLPQSPHLFNKSIYENISLSKQNATYEEVIASAKKARIDELISSLPDGYNSRIGEDASKLSGGEAQRIALARAYLRNSPLVLIDEPTANLDPIVEEEIMNDMYKLFEGRTVIIIAHRLNTILKADKIVLLENGKIVGIGTHNELLDNHSYYKNLFNSHNTKI